MKCLNCDSVAKYEVQNPGAEDQVFCAEHLPWFINLSHELGQRVMPITVAVPETPKVKASKPKPIEVPVEPVVEPVVE